MRKDSSSLWLPAPASWGRGSLALVKTEDDRATGWRGSSSENCEAQLGHFSGGRWEAPCLLFLPTFPYTQAIKISPIGPGHGSQI